MNILLHVGGTIAIFWMSSFFSATVDNDFLGWVFLVVGMWALVLTLMAIWFDLGKLFGRGQTDE